MTLLRESHFERQRNKHGFFEISRDFGEGNVQRR